MADALDGAAIFAGLDTDVLDDLRRIAAPFHAAAGEELFRQGDPPTGLFVVGSGLLEIASRMPGNEEAQVSRIGPGEVVGEFALLDPGPRSARVIARADTTGLFVPARSFVALLGEGRDGMVQTIDCLRGLVAGRTRATLDRLAREFAGDPCELRAAPRDEGPEPAPLDFEALRALGRFDRFGAAEGAAFLALGGGARLARGGLLSPAGSPSGHATLVVRGAVRAALPRGDRQDQVTVHGPGEWAGLVASIDGGAQPLVLSGAEESLLFRVPAATFQAWRTQPRAIERALLAGVDRQLVRDQRRANRHLGRAITLERFNAAGEAG